MLAETFALGARQSQRIVDDLLDRSGGAAPFSVHLAGPDDDAAALSMQVAADVFLECVRQHVRTAARASTPPLVPSMRTSSSSTGLARTAVGSVILQAAPRGSSKTVVDVAQPPWSVPAGRRSWPRSASIPADTTAADLLLLAVQPGYRRHGLGTLLLYAGWVASVGTGIDRWTAILDDAAAGRLRALSGGAVRRDRSVAALSRVGGQHADHAAHAPGRGRAPAAADPVPAGAGGGAGRLLRRPRAGEREFQALIP